MRKADYLALARYACRRPAAGLQLTLSAMGPECLSDGPGLSNNFQPFPVDLLPS
jgi:hypothetical protein